MSYALFERFPGTAALTRRGLCDLPTPVEPFTLELAAARLRVKRDDRTARAYGGNKARKLELLLGEALALGSRAVITFGAYGSNHALATAVHASAAGLETHVVLSPQAPGPFAARTLRAHVGLGTVLHPIDGWDGAREAVRLRRELTERDGIEPYVIPMGGTSALGAVGYVNAAFELALQCEAGGDPLPDVVYVAGGTIGTAVGLAVGFALLEARTRVQAVRVTPSEVCNPEIARSIAEGTLSLLRARDADVPSLDPAEVRLTLREEFYEPGYGVPTAGTHAAVRAAVDAGVPAETTYTGKALVALFADAAAGALEGADVLFWDTYNSRPLPPAGDVDLLPGPLREYVAACDAEFGVKE